MLCQNENENRNWAEFQTPPNATCRLCTFLAHTIRLLVQFSMGWNNLWVFIDFLHLLLYLSVHIYNRYIYSIVTLVNTHSLKFMPGFYHCSVFATIPYFYESSSLLEARSFDPWFAGSMSVTQIILSPGNQIVNRGIS